MSPRWRDLIDQYRPALTRRTTLQTLQMAWEGDNVSRHGYLRSDHLHFHAIPYREEDANVRSDIELDPAIAGYLETIGRPVRVLDGAARMNHAPDPSWSGYARANDTTIQDAGQRGITIVSWATDRGGDFAFTNMPSEMFEVLNRTPPPAEWIVPDQDAEHEDSHSVDGKVFCRTGDRIVWYMMPLTARDGAWEGIDLEAFLGAPISYALKEGEVHQRRQADQAREEFMRAMNSGIRSEIRELYTRIDRNVEEIAEAQRAIGIRWRERADATRRLRALEKIEEGDEVAEYEQKWQALVDHPRVERVKADGGRLVVTTGPVHLQHAEDPGRTVYLGRFDVKIPIGTDDYDMIRIVNLDNTKRRPNGNILHHPHIVYDNACFGEISDLVGSTIAMGDIPSLLEIVFQYLETYNPDDDWGRFASLWFDDEDVVEDPIPGESETGPAAVAIAGTETSDVVENIASGLYDVDDPRYREPTMPPPDLFSPYSYEPIDISTDNQCRCRYCIGRDQHATASAAASDHIDITS